MGSTEHGDGLEKRSGNRTENIGMGTPTCDSEFSVLLGTPGVGPNVLLKAP